MTQTCRKCGHEKKYHYDPPVRGNDEWNPGTYGVLLHCLPPYPQKGSSCGCDGFEPREQWGYTSHGSSERRTIVSGFESKEAALSHAREGSCTGRVVDVGRITHDADNRTQFEVVEKVEIQ